MSKFDLPVNEDYETQIGYSEIYKRNVYQIVNKVTRVIEFENPMFGTVKAVFHAIQQANDEGDEDDYLTDGEVINFPGMDDTYGTTH